MPRMTYHQPWLESWGNEFWGSGTTPHPSVYIIDGVEYSAAQLAAIPTPPGVIFTPEGSPVSQGSEFFPAPDYTPPANWTTYYGTPWFPGDPAPIPGLTKWPGVTNGWYDLSGPASRQLWYSADRKIYGVVPGEKIEPWTLTDWDTTIRNMKAGEIAAVEFNRQQNSGGDDFFGTYLPVLIAIGAAAFIGPQLLSALTSTTAGAATVTGLEAAGVSAEFAANELAVASQIYTGATATEAAAIATAESTFGTALTAQASADALAVEIAATEANIAALESASALADAAAEAARLELLQAGQAAAQIQADAFAAQAAAEIEAATAAGQASAAAEAALSDAAYEAAAAKLETDAALQAVIDAAAAQAEADINAALLLESEQAAAAEIAAEAASEAAAADAAAQTAAHAALDAGATAPASILDQAKAIYQSAKPAVSAINQARSIINAISRASGGTPQTVAPRRYYTAGGVVVGVNPATGLPYQPGEIDTTSQNAQSIASMLPLALLGLIGAIALSKRK